MFKISLELTDEKVSKMTVSYFDTILPCTSLVISKLGYLFAASENGPHSLYSFKSLGEDEEIKAENDEEMLFNPRELKNLV